LIPKALSTYIFNGLAKMRESVLGAEGFARLISVSVSDISTSLIRSKRMYRHLQTKIPSDVPSQDVASTEPLLTVKTQRPSNFWVFVSGGSYRIINITESMT
jgi:hypothetical protein